ncbi:hypothetical protein [Tautonia plasticadhaerens]|uniref:Sulfatase n=1 Tax=Tautonia plasticadhaerens TaxID=2527974 RepID=A0A518H7D7_9BACT|nr:hypothetical protein [Tautonia plasticadhaerens]QDV36778.1 hypothetical protein ElP_47070 [Tautonia plasticadhaerens]
MKTLVIGIETDDPDAPFGVPGLVHLPQFRNEGIRGVLVPGPEMTLGFPWQSFVAGRVVAASGHAPGGGSPGPMLWHALDEGNTRIDPILIGLAADRVTGPGSDHPDDRDRNGDRSRSGRAIEPDAQIARTRSRFGSLRRCMATSPWNLAMLIDAIPAPPAIRTGQDRVAARWLALDQELGETLDQLVAQEIDLSVLLVVLRDADPEGGTKLDPSPPGNFSLTSTKGLPPGELRGASLIDLTPALVALAGRATPGEWLGRPLTIDQLPPDASEDQEAVFDRLRGLGYLA